jgi:hypothetical protein
MSWRFCLSGPTQGSLLSPQETALTKLGHVWPEEEAFGLVRNPTWSPLLAPVLTLGSLRQSHCFEGVQFNEHCLKML